VNALGQCHPALVKALDEQGGSSGTPQHYRVGNGEESWPSLVDMTFADHDDLLATRARGDRGRHQVIRQVSIRQWQTQALQDDLLPGGVHGRLLKRAGRQRNEKYSKARPRRRATATRRSTRNVVREMIDDETAGILVETKAKAACAARAEFLKALRAMCDGVRPLLILRRNPQGFRPTPASLSPRMVGRRTPTSWRSTKDEAETPDGAFNGDREGGRRHGAGTNGSTYGEMMATGVANAVLDVLLQPGFNRGRNERGEYSRASCRR